MKNRTIILISMSLMFISCRRDIGDQKVIRTIEARESSRNGIKCFYHYVYHPFQDIMSESDYIKFGDRYIDTVNDIFKPVGAIYFLNSTEGYGPNPDLQFWDEIREATTIKLFYGISFNPETNGKLEEIVTWKEGEVVSRKRINISSIHDVQ